MMVRIYPCPSTWISLIGQTKHGRFYLLPNFPHKLNFTIFMGPILRHLIVFGNTSINSLYVIIVTLELDATIILQFWEWGQACHRSAKATLFPGQYICDCVKYLFHDSCFVLNETESYMVIHCPGYALLFLLL